MAVSFRFWNDCVDEEDMDAMWSVPQVRSEWLDAGESEGNKVHLSRDPDGNLYLTHLEIMAVVHIVVRRRYFNSQIRPEMICAIAELESDRQPLATRYNKKTKQTSLGIMQILPSTAEWLSRDMGYRAYQVEGNPEILFRPFVSIYFGAAYLLWLSNFEQKERTEEFVVRSYNGGTKKATHKSTAQYWKRYLSVKENLPSRKFDNEGTSSDDLVYGALAPVMIHDTATLAAIASRNVASLPPPISNKTTLPVSEATGVEYACWDARASAEEMLEMWNHPDVSKEWTKSGEKKGKVRFSHDKDHRPYLSQVELKAVADIILSKYFSTKREKPSVLCALADMVSMRFVHGVGGRTGLMGIDYSKAHWLYMELGYRAYKLESVDDLTKPFVSMYFGAAYLSWLSQYEGRERTPQFIIQAYLAGPMNVNLQQTGPLWLKFEQALCNYKDLKRDSGSCTIL